MLHQSPPSSTLRKLEPHELDFVSGGSNQDEEPEIVVTAKRLNETNGSGGGWSIGFGFGGAYGSITVTDLDVFFGIGVGRPGLSLDYEPDDDIEEINIAPDHAEIRIGVVNTATNAVNAVEFFAREFVDRHYPHLNDEPLP